ncbi:hypothetical protein [Leifsonia sp. Leaf264]|uniref:hypothetical protein n=1 Tax=Leifsonia sp. Leaf264 TaxID=1736314 RepID=UPI0006F423BF|nr:hypothetical protein [Leifsonia sp. Leaf264]KQO98539.1 hypothetical protein ASF30_10785 [Leifsonia sp. Leaf264]
MSEYQSWGDLLEEHGEDALIETYLDTAPADIDDSTPAEKLDTGDGELPEADDADDTVPHQTPGLNYSRRLHLVEDSFTDSIDEANIKVRVDPFYQDLWPVGSRASWVDVKAARDQVAAGIGRLPAHLKGNPADAGRKILRKLNPYLDVIAALDQFRVLTAGQLAAVTGNPALASGRSALMTDLFTVGAIEVGIFSNALFHTRDTPSLTLYRPGSSSFFDKKISPELTYAEWLSVTSGKTEKMGGQGHDRHAVLSAELALRVAELGYNVQNVVGERLSSAALLGFTGLGFKQPDKAKFTKAGDFTILRADGARVVVEVTATIGRALQQKIETWAQLLAGRRMDESGLAVIFVIAEHGATGSGKVRNAVYKMLRDACRKYPGPNFDRTCKRFGVADWREWFPASTHLSEDFYNLVCDRPTAPGAADFERAGFLNPADLPFNPEGDWADAALDNVAMLRGTPVWLRGHRNPVDLLPVLLEKSEWKTIPVPPLHRPDLTDGSSVFGVTPIAEAKPPKRMRV